MTFIAMSVCAVIVAGLFYLDRDTRVRPSIALWIPTFWMLIVCSREMSVWLNVSASATEAKRYTEGNAVDAATYGILTLAGLVVLNHRTQKLRSFLQANSILLLFLFYCLVSVMWSDSPLVSFKRWAKGVGVLAMVLVVITDPEPLFAMKRFLSRVAFILLPLSACFILFVPSLGIFYDATDRITYYIGAATQKNELGITCLIGGLGSLWSFLNAWKDLELPHRIRQLTAHGLILVSAVLLIKTCDSMTSLACLVIAGTVMVMTMHPWVRNRASNVHILVGSALTVAVFAALIDTSGVLLHLLGRNSTLTGRNEIWNAVLSFNTNPLVGTGYDSFWLGSRVETIWQIIGYTGVVQAHNGYLEVYLNLGWLGLCLLALLLAYGYRGAIVTLRSDPVMGPLKIALLTAGLISNLSEAGFRMMRPIWIAVLLAVITIPDLKERAKLKTAPGWGRKPSETQGPFRVLQ